MGGYINVIPLYPFWDIYINIRLLVGELIMDAPI